MTVFTDLSSLKWLMSRPNLAGRLARWSLRLQNFDFRIVHKRNNMSDALSRNPFPVLDAPMYLLPTDALMGSLDLHTIPLAI